MKAVISHCGLGRFGFVGALLLSTLSLRADPIAVGPGSIFEFGTMSAIIGAILVEAVCIVLLLRHSRTPRFFILWLMGMHALTYPIFLGVLWLSISLRPEAAIAVGEGMIVLIEGVLIYLLCCWVPSRKVAMPLPSVGKTLLASLVGNICSAAAFPLITILNLMIVRMLENSGMD